MRIRAPSSGGAPWVTSPRVVRDWLARGARAGFGVTTAPEGNTSARPGAPFGIVVPHAVSVPPQERAPMAAKNLIRLLCILLLLPVLSVLGSHRANASVTTGTIKGTTVDTGGLPIPGVLVTIASDSMMGTVQRETDEQGRFLYPELSPGIYVLTAEHAGFNKVQKTGIQVSIGRTAIITVEMPLQQAGEEMIIEEEGTKVDTETAQRSTVLTKEFLQRIPTGRSYQTAVQLSAGVTGGANANIGGAGSSENTYLLDGVNITDPVTGTFSLNFNFDAVEQLEVITSAYDPEYGINLGGAINLVTLDGGNTLKFSVNTYYTNANWAPKLDARYAADGLLLSPTDFDTQFILYQVGALVSGPIIRDKAWFIVSYQLDRSLISSGGIPLPRDYEGHYVYTKLTYQPTSAHRFRVLFQTDPTTVDNDQFDYYVQPDAQNRQSQGGFVASAQWDWFVSPEVFLESKNVYQHSYLNQSQVPCTHNQDLGYNPCGEDEMENNIDYETPPRLGVNGAYSSGNAIFDVWEDRNRWQTDNKFSVLQVDFLGTHDFKIGLEADRTIWNQVAGFPGNMYFYDINQLSYDPSSVQNWYWWQASGTYGFHAYGDHWGTFIQDVYKPIDNLTFRYGLRYDRDAYFDDTGTKVLGSGMFGPRFSVIWDPWGTGKTKFTGSAGRFNDAGRQAVAYGLFQSGWGQKLTLGEYFGNFTSEASNVYFYVPNVNLNTVADETIAPHSDEFTVGAEREVFKNVLAGLTFIGKYTRNLFSYDELNAIYDEDGYSTIGTGDGSLNTVARLRTPSIARRDYFSVQFYSKHDLADRWQEQFSYTYTSSRGSVQNTPSTFLANAAQIPYYLDGYLFTDVRHDITGGIAWDIPNDPWTTQVGATLFMETGNPVSRYYPTAINGNGQSAVLKDTYGSYAREEAYIELDLLVQQSIPVRKGKFKTSLEMQNVLLQHQGDVAAVSTDNRWVILSRQVPVGFTLGALYEF